MFPNVKNCSCTVKRSRHVLCVDSFFLELQIEEKANNRNKQGALRGSLMASALTHNSWMQLWSEYTSIRGC